MSTLALTLALASVLTPGAPLAPASLRVGVAPFPRPPRALLVCPASPARGRPLTDAASPLPLPEVPKPPYLVPICPAPFGLPVTRIANDPGQPMTLQNGTGTWGSDARHHYSKDQPWSADGSLLALQNDGVPRQVFLDGTRTRPNWASARTIRWATTAGIRVPGTPTSASTSRAAS